MWWNFSRLLNCRYVASEVQHSPLQSLNTQCLVIPPRSEPLSRYSFFWCPWVRQHNLTMTLHKMKPWVNSFSWRYSENFTLEGTDQWQNVQREWFPAPCSRCIYVATAYFQCLTAVICRSGPPFDFISGPTWLRTASNQHNHWIIGFLIERICVHVLFMKEDFVSVSVEVCKAYLYLFASSPLQLVTTDGAVVFSCHFKMETTALLQTFVLSLCSLPHHSQVYIHQNCFLFYSLSLSLFFFLSLFSCSCFRTFRGTQVDLSISLLAMKLNSKRDLLLIFEALKVTQFRK